MPTEMKKQKITCLPTPLQRIKMKSRERSLRLQLRRTLKKCSGPKLIQSEKATPEKLLAAKTCPKLDNLLKLNLLKNKSRKRKSFHPKRLKKKWQYSQ